LGAQQLIRFAERELNAVAAHWAREASSSDAEQAAIAREVLNRSKEKRFSVAPLFNDAANQVGRLIALDGVVRRAVRIDVGSTADNAPSDVSQLYGLDHYYELDIFTDDSQNRPVVFCVRELPTDFPTGAGLDLPVRVAGFYFKSWSYHPHTTSDSDSGEWPVGTVRRLISPLLIGRAPIVLEMEASPSTVPPLLTVGIFVLAFAAVWGLVWWYSREDREFRQRTLDPVYALPTGETLDAFVSGEQSGPTP
jgi:hypothetical protein